MTGAKAPTRESDGGPGGKTEGGTKMSKKDLIDALAKIEEALYLIWRASGFEVPPQYLEIIRKLEDTYCMIYFRHILGGE